MSSGEPESPAHRERKEIAALYSRVAPRYVDQGPPHFAHAGRRLVDLATVQPGDVVLDLGTGRGAVLIPAAERVGPSGRALGIDIASGMLESTGQALTRLGLRQASVELMDATRLDLDLAPFTHVLSSFTVFFFPDLKRLLADLRGRLSPATVTGFAFSRGRDPRWTWYEDSLRSRGALEGLPAELGFPGVREPGVLSGLLEAAGFADVRERVEATDFWFASAEAWWASLWTHGSRRPLERMAPDMLASVKREATARAHQMLEPRGVPERMQLVYVLARRPSS